MVTGTLQMTVKTDKRDELMQVLGGSVEPTRVMAGCICCGLYVDTQDSNRFAFHTTWETQDDLNCFMRTREFTALLLATDLLDEEPLMRFDDILRSEGMEAVRKARTGSAPHRLP
jgi:quinol monooxygenase YgiN